MPFGHVLTVDIASYRRKGIAQKLLCEIEAIFKEKGVKECRLEVREDNVAASNLHQKLGYKKVSKFEKYYGCAHGLNLKNFVTAILQPNFCLQGNVKNMLFQRANFTPKLTAQPLILNRLANILNTNV